MEIFRKRITHLQITTLTNLKCLTTINTTLTNLQQKTLTQNITTIILNETHHQLS